MQGANVCVADRGVMVVPVLHHTQQQPHSLC
jgi:hypothetical protein